MRRPVFISLLAMLLFIAMFAIAAERAAERHALIAAIRDDVEMTSRYTGRGRMTDRVMQAMSAVERHRFVPDYLAGDAYANIPLPIGHGQTISQPFIVALMTDLLGVDSDSVVLEIGTGSGYQAAVLAELVEHVFTIEIVEPLGKAARERLGMLGIENITTRIGDGYYGWQEHAPFDAIIVTAAASHVPPPLVRQLKPGGTMVIPVGSPFQVQQLTLIEKDAEGDITMRQLLPVRFVPLTGAH